MDIITKDIRLLVRCAQMYYEEGLNQAQISEKLKISKSSISRMLNSAKEEGIVQIKVNNPLPSEYIELEKQLEEKFGLKEAIVVDSKSNEPDEIKEELAKAGAEYLSRIVKNNYIVGVSWGTTLKKIPKYINNTRSHNITFVPMLGGIGQSNIDIHPNQIAMELAKVFNGDYKLLHAPCIVDDDKRKEAIIQERSIQNIFKLIEKIDVALIGIGSPVLNTHNMVQSGYYSEEDMNDLVEKGAVADLCSLIIDEHGKGDAFECNKRVVGIGLDDVKKIPLTIAVAGYEKKKEAILAALRGEYVDVLIVDNNTANSIIDMA